MKSLYGLRQAPKQWHDKFNETLTSIGFVVNEADKCVYYRYGGGEGVILCLYVDDILLIGNDVGMMTSMKVLLSQTFSIKDLGEATYILRIQVYRDRSKRIIGLS